MGNSSQQMFAGLTRLSLSWDTHWHWARKDHFLPLTKMTLRLGEDWKEALSGSSPWHVTQNEVDIETSTAFKLHSSPDVHNMWENSCQRPTDLASPCYEQSKKVCNRAFWWKNADISDIRSVTAMVMETCRSESSNKWTIYQPGVVAVRPWEQKLLGPSPTILISWRIFGNE